MFCYCLCLLAGNSLEFINRVVCTPHCKRCWSGVRNILKTPQREIKVVVHQLYKCTWLAASVRNTVTRCGLHTTVLPLYQCAWLFLRSTCTALLIPWLFLVQYLCRGVINLKLALPAQERFPKFWSMEHLFPSCNFVMGFYSVEAQHFYNYCILRLVSREASFPQDLPVHQIISLLILYTWLDCFAPFSNYVFLCMCVGLAVFDFKCHAFPSILLTG